MNVFSEFTKNSGKNLFYAEEGKKVKVKSTPQIRLVFMLTKNDSTDFDREAVTHLLGIDPSKDSAPTLSKGKLSFDGDISDAQKDLPGLTIIPAATQPYEMLKHAYWSVELPKVDCWELVEPLHQFEQIFAENQSRVLYVCEKYNLSASLIVRVFSASNTMPILTIPNDSVSYWASMNATIDFDFYLD